MKFRVWDSVGEKMILPGDITSVDLNDGVAVGLSYVNNDPFGLVFIDKFEVMMWTGLKDKNDVEIYEDDIVRILYAGWRSKTQNGPQTIDEYKNDIVEIGSVDFNVSWGVNFGAEYCRGDIEPGTHGFIEVIGNKYENEEMLS